MLLTLLAAGLLGLGCSSVPLDSHTLPADGTLDAGGNLAAPGGTSPAASAPLPDLVHPGHAELRIAYSAAWPKIPSAAGKTWLLRDWKTSSARYHALLFNEAAIGSKLPLIAFNANVVAIPSYVGDSLSTPGGGEALSVLGGLLGASLGGLDMRRYQGRDWLASVAGYTAATPNGRIVMNNRGATASPETAWYSLFPTILASQLASVYRTDTNYGLVPLMAEAATAWGAATKQLNNNWDHTGYRFVGASPGPIDLGWVEPDMAIGIAYLAEAAMQASLGTRTDLNTLAQTCLAQMDARSKNPFYEVLGYYGPTLAARRNALRGANHNVAHFLSYVFAASGDARPIWGMNNRRWGDYDAFGLMGEVTPEAASVGYGFSMNTFTAAAAIAPLARYMPGYAKAIGRYLLHVAVNGQLFFADALPEDCQDNYPLVQASPLLSTVTYESMRGYEGRQPLATGDSQAPRSHLTPYGSWSQGYMAALFKASNDAWVPQIDLLATDFWHPPAYPTYLYYNPRTTAVSIDVPIPEKSRVDFVDIVTGRTLARGVQNKGTLVLAADQAVVLVMPPSGAALTQAGKATLLSGVTIDYGLQK